MRVYLVQHGLAKEKDQDAARPLSAQGREDVTRIAGFLGLFEKPRPVRILHSGKLRAQQTAEMFSEAWGNIPVAQAAGLSPDDDLSIWADRLNAMDEDLLLIGHLPHLQRLAGLMLCADSEREVVRFRNGGVVCLERYDNGWSILWQLNPTLFYGEDK